MPIETQSLGHLYWNQILANQAPHADEPDAYGSLVWCHLKSDGES